VRRPSSFVVFSVLVQLLIPLLFFHLLVSLLDQKLVSRRFTTNVTDRRVG
jgi:hypothetical protein